MVWMEIEWVLAGSLRGGGNAHSMELTAGMQIWLITRNRLKEWAQCYEWSLRGVSLRPATARPSQIERESMDQMEKLDVRVIDDDC